MSPSQVTYAKRCIGTQFSGLLQVSVPVNYTGVPMPTAGLICSHCNDASDVVSPFNGSTLLASTPAGEVIVALHTRCEGPWAERNDFRSLVPLKKLRRTTASRAARHSLQLAS